MPSILDRVHKLLALAASPNANEARNAAYLAAKLIREHRLELREPAGGARRPTPSGRKATPEPTRVKTPPPKRKSHSSKGGVHAVREVPTRITSPLGGDCVVCGKRYRAGSEVFWSDAEGGLHPACIDAWGKRRGRR
ncbi:MAG: DUF2786 domain-containing protein [Polyangiaceae bacterium]